MVHRIFTQKFWHELFEAGVFLKAVNSIWETSVGIFLLVNTHPSIRDKFVFFSREEYLGGREDFLFRFVSEQLNHISFSTRNFIGLYLLFHGLLNMFLAYNLYKDRLWAYPTAIGISSLFLVYQLYRITHTHSLLLLLITLFDVVFIGLTWHEYRYQHHTKHTQTITP